MTSPAPQRVERGLATRRIRNEHIYGLPVVGDTANRVRDFYDDLEPQDDDSRGQRAGKNTIRYGSVAVVGAGATALAALLML